MKSNINKKHAPLKKELQFAKKRKNSGERLLTIDEARKRGHKLIELWFEGKSELKNPFLTE